MTTAQSILDGALSPSAAYGKPELYDELNAGKNGQLRFLGMSYKINSGESAGFLTRVLYMMPARESGREACGGRGKCADVCLVDTGRMGGTDAIRARRRRHASFFSDRGRFLADLAEEIAALEKSAQRKGMIPAVRLNGTTDIPWERYSVSGFSNLMAMFPNVRFYDYTKLALEHRTRRGKISLPKNYHLTFSISERPDAETRAAAYIEAGFSVAVVFAAKKGALPSMWKGARVIDGDKNDARFIDPPGVYVGLSAKGRAKKDNSGFVKNPESE